MFDQTLENDIEILPEKPPKLGTKTSDKNIPAENESQTAPEDLPQLETKLVPALDQLVMMKKQGYLDENEFNIAKTRILNELANAPHTD